MKGQDGRWDTPGRSRLVRLSDSTTVREEITLAEPPSDGLARFGYAVTGFGGPFGRLTGEARGFWAFRAAGDETEIAWRYAFAPRSSMARPALAVVIPTLWRAYMRAALRRTEELLSGAGKA